MGGRREAHQEWHAWAEQAGRREWVGVYPSINVGAWACDGQGGREETARVEWGRRRRRSRKGLPPEGRDGGGGREGGEGGGRAWRIDHEKA